MNLKTLTPTTDDLCHFAQHEAIAKRPIAPEIKARIVTERAVIRHALQALFAAGYRVQVFDGEERATLVTDNLDAVMAAVCACDEEWLYVYAKREDDRWVHFGTIYLVYGNDGPDVIADHHTKLEDVLAATSEFAESLYEFAGA